ncbi:hypothetical protein SteCoe_15112 [Stentor coeruleus]|uniref:CCHC-type domain-containing protein n=1 Tax=Stentor coeruleus TaxID=5963 RepID=A0A1R2C4C8_9CILI|nr:hypothetical protein SteCoe_15112 [Stentor coeruleus]
MRQDIDLILSFQQTKEQKHTKILKFFKEKSQILNEENKALSALNESLEKNNQELEHQKNTLTNETTILRKSINNYIFKNKVHKVCKNCKKMYKEEENFNWSCKIHMSKYNGNMFWCCGKIEINAKGCVVSKHISGDDEDGQEKLKEENMKFCSNCREAGHGPKECPKDPNTRTNFDPMQELDRIENYKKHKTKINAEILKHQLSLNDRTKFKDDDNDCLEEEFDDLEDIKNVSINDSDMNKYKIEEPESPSKNSAKKHLKVFSNIIRKLD